MMDYAALKVALTGLPDDPVAAAAALSAQTVTEPVDIATSEARAVVLVTGEWFRIKQLAKMPLSGKSPPTTQDQAIAAADVCLDTLQLTETLHTAQDDVWAAVQQMLGALHVAGVVSDATLATWTAMRTRTTPVWPKIIIADDVIAARSMA